MIGVDALAHRVSRPSAAMILTMCSYEVPIVSISEKIYHALTLSMREPSYLGLIKLISWLLMPWLLASPGHQQP